MGPHGLQWGLQVGGDSIQQTLLPEFSLVSMILDKAFYILLSKLSLKNFTLTTSEFVNCGAQNVSPNFLLS